MDCFDRRNEFATCGRQSVLRCATLLLVVEVDEYPSLTHRTFNKCTDCKFFNEFIRNKNVGLIISLLLVS